MSICIGQSAAVIFGIREVKPIVNIPNGAISVKIRMRRDDVATAFVRFRDRVEKWYLGPVGGRVTNHAAWELIKLQGVNQRIG